MENLNIKLSTGRIVTVEAFHIILTYGGLLHGKPNKTLNDEILKTISFPENWGYRKSVLKTTNLYSSKDVLKPIIYSVWLSSDTVDDKEEEFYGSSIIAVWLGDKSKNKSISEIIIDGLGEFDWEKHAQNYNP